uniref:ectonucleoside triphosphate diphosphohydrolase 8 isoform X3 n=1 Tax=Panthera onca TaxID=9690 RepID=UPI0029540764|nr:ectonucleoside triphosphate diphosphohydrolase 8 isoform X3 [Panthera onca]
MGLTWKPRVLTALLGAAVASGLTALILILVEATDVLLPTDTKFGIVFDAGSSHTSLFVYRWPADKENDTGVVSQALVCQAKGPGISSYASSPARAGESLQGCLEEALALIPEAQQRKTPMFLGATAGMRLLSQKNSSQARDIFEAVTQVLGKSPLDFWGAELLAGQDEGALGWITINYVLGMLVKYSFSGEWIQPLEGTLVGALDMGGASTQITFVPGGPILDKSTQTTFRLYGSEHSVYTHSYLCFGRDQMLSRLLAQLVQLRPPGPPPMLPQRLLGHAVPGRPLRVPLCAHSSPSRAGREPHCGRDREPRGLYLSHPGPLQLLQLPGPRTLCLQWGLPAPCAGPVLCLLQLLLHLPLPESHLQAATGHRQRHHLGVLPEALEAGGGQLARAGPLAS